MRFINHPNTAKFSMLPFLAAILTLLPACASQLSFTDKALSLKNAFEQCIAVPEQTKTLVCINTKDVDNGVPINMGEYYLVTEGKPIKSLTRNQNVDSSFGYLVFSPKGKYLYIAYADEGHPYFVFYDTTKFINDDKSAELDSVSQYRVDSIDELYDNGDVAYSLSDCFDHLNSQQEVEVPTELNNAEKEQCEFHYNIFTHTFINEKAQKGNH